MNIEEKMHYFRIMLLLEESPDLTQREIAQKLSVSYDLLNYCLRSLIHKGFVKVNSKNKFGYVYVRPRVGFLVGYR
jgi:predicted transcriptional regulator